MCNKFSCKNILELQREFGTSHDILKIIKTF